MIIVETVTINDDTFTRVYSDAGFKIRNTETGFRYDEAIDPVTEIRNYEETLEPISSAYDGTDLGEIEAMTEAIRILFGGDDYDE